MRTLADPTTAAPKIGTNDAIRSASGRTSRAVVTAERASTQDETTGKRPRKRRIVQAAP